MSKDGIMDYDIMKKEIDFERLPKHIAIIMDGNGRWAKKRLMPRSAGHKAGVERVKEIVETAGDLGLEHLTLYAFSTENWKRPKGEVDALMKLLVIYIKKELNRLHKNDVKIQTIGDLSKIPESAKKEVIKAIEKTKNNKKLVLNIALNYGGKNEIVSASKRLAERVEKGELKAEDITPETFEACLYTSGQPDPDLLIRPSGELRISNFLLYQIAYSEFWFSNIYWPDFTKSHLCRAIIDFQKRVRRYGGIKDDE